MHFLPKGKPPIKCPWMNTAILLMRNSCTIWLDCCRQRWGYEVTFLSSHLLLYKCVDFFIYRSNVSSVGRTLFTGTTGADIPDKLDWREKGAVTPVKNQGRCGSCWSFSTTGALEGQQFMKSGNLVPLSEQNLIDCSRSYGNQGCRGGWMDSAFTYVQRNGGIDTEESYPYQGSEGICRYNPRNSGATVSGLVDIPEGDENKLKEGITLTDITS